MGVLDSANSIIFGSESNPDCCRSTNEDQVVENEGAESTRVKEARYPCSHRPLRAKHVLMLPLTGVSMY